MISPTYDFKTFFDQLGLPSDEQSIIQFLDTHHLPDGVPIHKASFWTPSQSSFICQALANDGDWAIVVDQISNLLNKNS
jgi:hypothetical protein